MSGGADLLVTGVRLFDPAGPRGLEALEDAFVWIRGGRIAARGPRLEIPSEAARAPSLDGGGAIALPGLVDSHTHAVFGATREHEFERRLEGATYREIAAAGGGILFSVRDLRGRDEDDLVRLSRPRIAGFAAHGVTTVEVKSGYGLSTEDELRQLRVVERLAKDPSLPRLVATFLGAHAIPPEFAGDRAGYVRLVCEETLPAVVEQGVAEFCDVFCDDGAFTVAESERILSTAKDLGLELKIHAEEFVSTGGAAMAARVGATSADHLVAIDEAGIEALARSGTVAVLLPGTTLFLGHDRFAPGRRLVDAGVQVALATDFNPGSSMTRNLPLVATLGCLRAGLTISEALGAVTRGGAAAIGRDDRGTLEPGALGDLALFDLPDARHLVYDMGAHATVATIRGGRVIWRAAGRAEGAAA